MSSSCGVQDHAAGKKKLNTVAAGGFQVGDVVLRTQRNTDETVAGLGDLYGVQHAVGALNGGHHAGRSNGDTGFPLNAFDHLLTVDDILRIVGLGKAHHLYTGSDDSLQVLDTEAA